MRMSRRCAMLALAFSSRGIRVDGQARQRILSCTDMAALDRWFERALSAATLTDVLDARDNGGAIGRE